MTDPVPAPSDRRPTSHLPRPTLRGGVLGGIGLLALLSGLVGERADLVLVGLTIVLAIVGSHLALLARPPRLVGYRSVRPDAVHAGDESAVAVTVRDLDGRPLPMHHWRDGRPAGLEATPWHSAQVTAIGPDAATLRYGVRPARRGVYELGPLRIHRLDPLGLARIETVVGETAPLLVPPRVTPLDDSPLDRSAADGSELVLLRRAAPSVDEVSARDYERGDPLRRVNWRASAKRGRLMVREEEQRSDPRSWIVLDTMGERRRAGEEEAAFELALELVASLGAHAIGRGFAVGVVETGTAQLDGEELGAGVGYAAAEGERRLTTQLAAVAPGRNPGRGLEALTEVLRRATHAAPVFAVLASGEGARRQELAGIGGLGEPAVAFLLGADAVGARAELEPRGWGCVVVEPTMTVVEAWAAAHRGGQS